MSLLGQRFVELLFGETGFPQRFPKAQVATQGIHERVYFHPGRVLIFCFDRFVGCCAEGCWYELRWHPATHQAAPCRRHLRDRTSRRQVSPHPRDSRGARYRSRRDYIVGIVS